MVHITTRGALIDTFIVTLPALGVHVPLAHVYRSLPNNSEGSGRNDCIVGTLRCLRTSVMLSSGCSKLHSTRFANSLGPAVAPPTN